MIFIEDEPKKTGVAKRGNKKDKKIAGNNKSETKKEKIEYLEWENVDKITETAIYYGFSPLEAPIETKEDILAVKNFQKNENLEKTDKHRKNMLLATAEERAVMTRTYSERFAIGPQQVMLILNGFAGDGKNRKTIEKKVQLEIMGTSKAIAEALAIRTSLSALSDYGYKDLMVEVNSIGDKESINRFTRELTSYYPNNINSLSASCRQAMKKDIFSVLECDDKACSSIIEESPKSLSCLSDTSRDHFREVLEYLEKMEIVYKINNCLVGDRHLNCQTVFEIKGRLGENGSVEALAFGTRYDTLARKFGQKKDVPTLSVKLEFKNNLKSKDLIKKIRKPRLHFTQLGFDAKYKALNLIEFLRENHIMVHQSLSRDKMGSQLGIAEKMRIPFVIIMGQKEAIDNTVMIRNLKTRSQRTVSIKELPEMIKGSEWY